MINSTIEQTVALARSLRRNKTPAERKLWRELRDMNANGLRFRQQAPIGRFIADFCEHSKKLVIEVDGNQHGEPKALAHDTKRTAWLEFQGYKVIRFSNTEVLTNIEGVVIEIMIATDTLPADSSVFDADKSLLNTQFDPHHPPTPNPSPQGGGELDRALGEITATNSALTPSPLVGEGWGGGAGADAFGGEPNAGTTDLKVQPSKGTRQ